MIQLLTLQVLQRTVPPKVETTPPLAEVAAGSPLTEKEGYTEIYLGDPQ